MPRRLIAAAALSLIAVPSAAQDLRGAFYALPREDRKVMQEHLAEPGFYASDIDGLWGPGTARAVDAARATLAYPNFADTARAAGLVNEAEIVLLYVQTRDFRASIAARR